MIGAAGRGGSGFPDDRSRGLAHAVDEEDADQVNRDQWIEAFAAEIGVSPPDQDQVQAILELAATAAHGSERTAAPVAAWLGGASGKSLSELNEAARRIASRA